MEFVIGQISQLMDARFAAATGSERVVLNPWPMLDNRSGELLYLTNEIVPQVDLSKDIWHQTYNAWNEIKGWITGPEIWLAVPAPYLVMALDAYESLEDCKGIVIQPDGQAHSMVSPSSVQPEIPSHIPYALHFPPFALNPSHAWTSPQSLTSPQSPQWTVIPYKSLGEEDTESSRWVNVPRYVQVENIEELKALVGKQEFASVTGIYLQATAGISTDYEAWQAIIDSIYHLDLR